MSSGKIQSAECPAKVRLSPLREVEALLSKRLYDLKHRLSLTFKINSTVAISETGIVGDVVVSAVITVWGLVVRCQTASLA